jgi:hypothetical protein
VNKDMIAPLTGVAFVVVAIISILIYGGDPPDADSPPAEIVQHYVDDKDSIFISGLLGVLATALLVFFAAHLRTVLRAGDGQGSMLPSVVLAGATILGVGLAIDGTISIALAEAAEDIDPIAVQALQALWDNDFLPLALGMSVFWLSTGLAVVLYGALPKWLGWFAILFGVCGVTPAFFVGFLGGAIWILIVSVMLARQARPATPAPPPAPAAP